MTKTLLLALSLLLSAAWLQAESQYPQTGSSQTGSTATGQTTVQGCLQSSNGSYTLTDNTGATYQLQGDTSKLSAHAGHEVQITGTSASEPSTSSSTGTQTAGARSKAIDVKSVKHISESCKSGSKY
jgi:Protein of unknown function (DUF5818)